MCAALDLVRSATAALASTLARAVTLLFYEQVRSVQLSRCFTDTDSAENEHKTHSLLDNMTTGCKYA